MDGLGRVAPRPWDLEAPVGKAGAWWLPAGPVFGLRLRGFVWTQVVTIW